MNREIIETPGGASDAPEDRERQAALRRGREREHARALGIEPTRDANSGIARTSVAARAFAALAENVRDYAIFLMNPDGVITFWGEGARLIKWWTKDQAEGAHLRLLYPSGGSDDGTAENHLVQAMERGEYSGEGQRIRSDGSTFWAGITLTALRDESGELIGFAKVTRDLTARRAADAMLEAAAAAADKARADAVAASVAKSGFLASMSHEIRTPVNAVLGYLELLDLEIDGPLTPRQKRHLARAGISARHLLELITEVLDFSRIEANHMDVAREAFRLGDAVAGALALVAPQAQARGLSISDAVSGYAAGLAAWGDRSRVRQILANLLSNSVKFTAPRDGQGGRITVSAGTATQASPDAQLGGEGPWVYVRVEDTGVGIPANQLDPIFDAFVQADMTLTRPHGGAGLGLAISRRLARLMGGDITARSEEGVGSTFFLWLPAAPAESLQTGGVPGHGPGAEGLGSAEGVAERGQRGAAAPSARSVAETIHQYDDDELQPHGPLAAAAGSVLAELEPMLDTYRARLRSDPSTPTAHVIPESQVEDHLASFFADLAGTLQTLADSGGSPEDAPGGEAMAALRDSTAIQRVVSERHGAQRARLGWAESEVRREFEILREELAAAVRRRAATDMPGPNRESREAEAERALELLDEFIAVAERLSIASYRRAASTTGEPIENQTADRLA